MFPQTQNSSVAGVPANALTSQTPNIPQASDFHNEPFDLVVFPEEYILSTDLKRVELLAQLARKLHTHLLVGAGKPCPGRRNGWEVLLLFEPDGRKREIYTKHSTAVAIAFESGDWKPEKNLPVFEIDGVKIGVSICHDLYLGLLQRYLGKRGAQIWVNPSYDNVVEEKWGSLLRLRAVENCFIALCTLHNNLTKRKRTHPFGFGPDGRELQAWPLGAADQVRPLSEFRQPGIYIVDVLLNTPCARRRPALLPKSKKRSAQRSGGTRNLVRVSLKGSRPAVWDGSEWKSVQHSKSSIDRIKVTVGLINNAELFEIEKFFELLLEAKKVNYRPLFWNMWDQLPAKPEQLVSIMMGRSLEFCAPLVLSDREKIYEVTEIANNEKNLRRITPQDREVLVDLSRAWGLDNAFKMVEKHLRGRDARELALGRYISLMGKTIL